MQPICDQPDYLQDKPDEGMIAWLEVMSLVVRHTGVKARIDQAFQGSTMVAFEHVEGTIRQVAGIYERGFRAAAFYRHGIETDKETLASENEITVGGTFLPFSCEFRVRHGALVLK